MNSNSSTKEYTNSRSVILSDKIKKAEKLPGQFEEEVKINIRGEKQLEEESKINTDKKTHNIADNELECMICWTNVDFNFKESQYKQCQNCYGVICGPCFDNHYKDAENFDCVSCNKTMDMLLFKDSNDIFKKIKTKKRNIFNQEIKKHITEEYKHLREVYMQNKLNILKYREHIKMAQLKYESAYLLSSRDVDRYQTVGEYKLMLENSLVDYVLGNIVFNFDQLQRYVLFLSKKNFAESDKLMFLSPNMYIYDYDHTCVAIESSDFYTKEQKNDVVKLLAKKTDIFCEIMELEKQQDCIPFSRKLLNSRQSDHMGHVEVPVLIPYELSKQINSYSEESQVVFCKKDKCKGFLTLIPDSKIGKCDICPNNKCYKCMTDNINPIQHICDKRVLADFKFLENGKYKKCPFCGIYIERSAGCDSMFCVVCKERFDWTSGRKIDKTDNPHYRDYTTRIGDRDVDTFVKQLSQKELLPSDMLHDFNAILSFAKNEQKNIEKTIRKPADYIHPLVVKYVLTCNFETNGDFEENEVVEREILNKKKEYDSKINYFKNLCSKLRIAYSRIQIEVEKLAHEFFHVGFKLSDIAVCIQNIFELLIAVNMYTMEYDLEVTEKCWILYDEKLKFVSDVDFTSTQGSILTSLPYYNYNDCLIATSSPFKFNTSTVSELRPSQTSNLHANRYSDSDQDSDQESEESEESEESHQGSEESYQERYSEEADQEVDQEVDQEINNESVNLHSE